jgi:O-antigen ligase
MDHGLVLIRMGAALTGAGILFSLWASPDRLRSLPAVVINVVGVVLVLGVTGRLLPAVSRRIRHGHVTAFFLAAAFFALGAALFTSRWPAYKLSWLNSVYVALPSIRSLPFAWASEGLQPNQTGGILAVCTGFAVALALDRSGLRRVYRLFAAFLSLAGFVVVFLTGSRAALAALMVAVLLVILVRTRRWLWAWVTGLAVALVGSFASGLLADVARFFLRDESLETKLVARLDIWAAAARGIEDHFLTGIGLNVFNQVMPVRYPYQTVGLSYPVSQAHNLFLDVALSIGLLGILGFVALLLGSVIVAVRGSRQDAPSNTICTGLLASIAAFVVFGLIDSISLAIPTSFVVWLWACALVVLERKDRTTVCEDRYNHTDLPADPCGDSLGGGGDTGSGLKEVL